VETGKSAPTLKILGWTPDEVLGALKTDWAAYPLAKPHGVLARVNCRTGTRSELFREPGADFGNSVVARGGKHLYFSGAKGLSLLNMKTGEATVLATAPLQSPKCATLTTGARAVARDLPLELTHNVLRFHRGGPCGGTGAWVATPLEIRDESGGILGHGGTVSVHQPHPVATVVGGGGDVLWLGDAGRCDEPGPVDRATNGVVWRSDDAGKSWREISVIDPKKGRMLTAAKGLWTDLTRPNHVLVLSAQCHAGGTVRGGSLFRTRDGGKRWQKIRVGRRAKSPGRSQNILGVQPRDGDLNRLFVWTNRGVFRTRDFGAHWARVHSRGPSPKKVAPSPPRYVQIGGFIFRATDDGLLRREQATRKVERVFPPK
jgi:hypothetical protein